MKIDRQKFFDSLGGPSVVAAMGADAKADALERYLIQQLDDAGNDGGTGSGGSPNKKYPSAAEIEAEIETRNYRLGAGTLFYSTEGHVARLARMPEKPTLADFFRLRFMGTSNHVLQSAYLAVTNHMPEEVVMACLLHDTAQALMRVDHGWWGAQLYEPYVSPKVAFAIRYHQALRFYADKENGYEYPELYLTLFGEDYKPEPYIEATYKMVRAHEWYMDARLVTINDLYSFEPGVNPKLEQFTDLIGRQFKQPKEGLGYDASPVAHLWRSLAMPDRPL